MAWSVNLAEAGASRHSVVAAVDFLIEERHLRTSTPGIRLRDKPSSKSTMKKSSHSTTPKKAISPSLPRKGIAPLGDEPFAPDIPADEADLAADQFTVVAREDEAASSGHRVEPIEADDEHIAEKLIEEGLHGYLRASPNKSRKAK